jgi:uncharacterized membrane protein YbhN (UPF0104 family)
MDALSSVRTALWVVVSVLGLALFLWAVGPTAVVDAVGRVARRDAAVLVLVGFLPVVCWGVALHLVLRGLGLPVSLPASVALFAATSFLNNVTPFGRAGGDPASGLLVARVGDVPFERALAGVVSVGVATNLALVGLGLVAGTGLLATAAVDGAVTAAVLGGAGVTAVGGVVAVVGWRRRDRVATSLAVALARAVAPLAHVPGVDPPGRAAVAGRVDGFVAALERVAGDGRRVGGVLVAAVAGQAAVVATLALALRAVGAGVPLLAVVAVVPVARLAGLSPTPGGTASAETLLTGLLVAVGGVVAPVAVAAVLLYRAAAFWVPTLVGGLLTAALGTAHSRR